MATASISSHRALAVAFLVALAGVAVWCAFAGTPAEGVRLVPCPVLATTGVPCPGCGMTRACVALAHGEVASAWSFHPFAFLLVPLAIAYALWPRGTRTAWGRMPGTIRLSAVAAALAGCLLLWVQRLGS